MDWAGDLCFVIKKWYCIFYAFENLLVSENRSANLYRIIYPNVYNTVGHFTITHDHALTSSWSVSTNAIMLCRFTLLTHSNQISAPTHPNSDTHRCTYKWGWFWLRSQFHMILPLTILNKIWAQLLLCCISIHCKGLISVFYDCHEPNLPQSGWDTEGHVRRIHLSYGKSQQCDSWFL